MKMLRNTVIAVVVLGAISAFAIAQDESLRVLPEDTAFVVNVNLQSLFSILPDDLVADMRKESIKDIGVDLFGSSQTVIAGVSSNSMTGGVEDMYILFRGNLTVDNLINAAKAKDRKVVQKQIASLTAFTLEDEESGGAMDFVANAGPGMLVFGSEAGLEKYQKVASGQMKNAVGNSALIAASQDILPNSLFSVYGILPESFKAMTPQLADVNSMALAANYSGNFLTIRMVFNAGTEASLQALDMMIQQYSQMSAQMDSTGTFEELVDNLKTEIVGTKMTISTGMSKAGIDKIAKQIKAMASMASGIEEDYDQDDEY